MPFEIIRNDITNMRVDAIVNTANPRPVIGSGTDAAVHAKAGPGLLAARKLIGIIDTGEAWITAEFRLPAKYVIHTVGPVWYDGVHGESELLRQCYTNALELAGRQGVHSIAFPLISSGNYGFPKKLALKIAVETIKEFLETSEMQVFLVVFSKESFDYSGDLTDNIRSFIDERYVREREQAEYSFSTSRDYDFVQDKLSGYPAPMSIEDDGCINDLETEDLPLHSSRKRPKSELRKENAEKCAPSPFRGSREEKKAEFDPKELMQLVRKMDTGFSESLLRLIDQSGLKDSQVYKRANVSRQHFSKIRNNPQYKPSKATAVAFAIALELNLEETRDFIGRAGYALSRSNKFDIIIEYFITHERYDIYEINMMLFEFDQSLLGA